MPNKLGMKLGRSKRQTRRPAITSSPPKAVFSYYSNRADENVKTGRQKAAKNPKITYMLRHLPAVIAGAALLVSAGYLLSLSSNPRIVPLNTNDPEGLLRGQDEYGDRAKQLLGGSLANKSKITINVNKFESEMKRSFPELANVVVTLPLMGRRPIVKLEAASPVLVLREDGGASYLIDNSGRAIIKTDAGSSEKVKNLPQVTDKSGLKVEVGRGILTADETAFILTVLNHLKAKNIRVESMSLPTIASEIHIKIVGQPYYVKFDLQGDARAQAGTYLAVKAKVEADKVIPAEYIDVRVEEKAYLR